MPASLSPQASESLRKLGVSMVLFFGSAGCVQVAAARVGASRRVRGLVARLEAGGSASGLERCVVFATHGGGLVGCFLVWGVLQERMMTTAYDGEKFATSSVLVFANKAFAAAAALLLWAPWREKRAPACAYKPLPFVAFTWVAVSNTLSSWAQLEALKFVSFPTQVLAKASKLIPALAVGRLVNGSRYGAADYGVAAAITGGTALFMLAQAEDPGAGPANDDAGGLLMLGAYLLFDSATGPLQARFYGEHGADNGLELAQSGDAPAAWAFFAAPGAPDLAVLSLASTAGQVVIYTTLELYGNVTFTVMMIVRQIVSILVSCYRFGHVIAPRAWLGVVVVFAATASTTRSSRRAPAKKVDPPAATATATPRRSSRLAAKRRLGS
ncbi:UDP-galactose transmembrane transporter [Aureococcus anophagefferens]|nr:UDP-galactose transmembrane transporter [Aureococcus anophagefferens]